jgi:hypothetical protein
MTTSNASAAKKESPYQEIPDFVKDMKSMAELDKAVPPTPYGQQQLQSTPSGTAESPYIKVPAFEKLLEGKMTTPIEKNVKKGGANFTRAK